MLFLTTVTYAQELKGVVLDENDVPLAGANLVCTDSKNYAVTDFDGKFTIQVNKNDKITVSYVGYKTVTLSPVFPKMNIKLEPDSNTLEEVVVVGYGTRKAVDATMSIAKVKAEDLALIKTNNILQNIQGKLSGVSIVSSDKPGEEAYMAIRGVNTVIADTKPLYIIDGIRQNNMNNINVNDIESFEVLKDAAALAIYGNESSNGVILITSKKRKGDIQITLDNYFSYRTPLKMVEMAPSNLYAQYTNLASNTVFLSQDQPVNTNWFKEVMQPGLNFNNDISISGGTDTFSANFGFNHFEENSILIGSKYKRNILRFGSEFKKSIFKLNSTINVGFTNDKPRGNDFITLAYRMAPIIPVYNNDGNYAMSLIGSNGFFDQSGTPLYTDNKNPVASESFVFHETKNINLLGGVKLDTEILNGLKNTTEFGGEINKYSRYYFNNHKEYYFVFNPTAPQYIPKRYNINGVEYDVDNDLTRYTDTSSRWNLTNYLTYSKIFFKFIDTEIILGGEIASKGIHDEIETYTINLKNTASNFWNNSMSLFPDGLKGIYRESTPRHTQSLFNRFNFKFFDKYLLTFNQRYDGSSRYAPGYRWGYFPAFGAGWVVSKEKFLINNSAVSLLKIRGGWGLLGNESIGDNIRLNQDYNSQGYSFGGPLEESSSAVSSFYIDTSLTWEVTREYTFGLDYGLFDNKITGAIDYYNKLNRNTILNIKGVATDGSASTFNRNIGKVLNEGVEFSLNYKNKFKESFKYGFGVNMSYNYNELLEVNKKISQQVYGMGYGGDDSILKMKVSNDAVGQPVGSWWIYEYAGIDNEGQFLYYKKNGEKVRKDDLAFEDRKFFGSPLPNLIYGFNFNFGYKRFDLSVQTYGTSGSKVYNAKKHSRLSNENVELSVAKDFWTPTNTDAKNPAPYNGIPAPSTFFLESGDFFRVNSINLSFDIGEIANLIKGGSFYVNVQNPFIYQEYSGFSPEILGGYFDTMGVEYESYPKLRTFVFGIKFSL